MFAGLGAFVARWRYAVIAAGVAFIVVGGGWGTSVFGALVSGGFADKGSESAQAKEAAAALGRDGADVVVLFRNPNATVNDQSYRQAVESAVAAIPATGNHTHWNTPAAPVFVANSGHSTYAALTLADREKLPDMAAFNKVRDQLASQGYEVKLGGAAAINDEISTQIGKDIAKAETLSMPVLFVLLVIVFGGLAAASLPLVVGGIAVLGAFTSLKVISYFTDVSVFAVNVVTILGMGLAIDYGLFIVSRFREELSREELANGSTDRAGVNRAIARTMATAGRTVAVSAVTVAVALSGLLIFPQVFLTSMGYGGIAAVLIAALAALTVLPALLAILGQRVNALSVQPLLRKIGLSRKKTHADEDGAWYRLAASVMRRPLVWAVPIIALLLLLGSPFLGVRFGSVDARVLPESSPGRQVSETLRQQFPGNDADPMVAVVRGDSPSTAPGAATAFVNEVNRIPGAHAIVRKTVGSDAVVDIAYPGESVDAQAKSILGQVRALPRPEHASQVLVGGSTAEAKDLLDSLAAHLPWMGLLVFVATFLLLFLAFGSVVLPLKAIVMNTLSLSASFGAITWIFQDGHLSNWLNFTATGSIEATQPILVLAIVFGLSMDYEVFLLSRVREQYDLTGDNTKAVATGLQRTGRIITSAALLLIVVIAGFSASEISFIKLIGVAMLIAIAVDATLVRAILVPATMRLLGDANWWAPGPLKRVYARYGIAETDEVPAESVPEPVLVKV
jgi:uncharacterized membrane protein YdfJ with MMPL/SSD domain